MRASLPAAALGAAVSLASPVAAADEVMVEVHFKPVPRAQIAVWIEDGAGNFVQDVLVTQATGKLGIGNRPGIWNFLSSWRAPYGPRPSVLPIWAHRRGAQYPRLRFHDPLHDTSLGFHESSSSAESYYCRPLTPDEHAVISVDTMTCPSPNIFSTDKGQFEHPMTSPYPPRNDLLEVNMMRDSQDVAMFAGLNDLDAVTAATPVGDGPEYFAAVLPAALVAGGSATAWIEISLEHDENPSYDYDREDDHFIDPSLSAYGVEYLGQPSVVYRVAFDPRQEGFRGTSDYVGYGDWDGKSGAMHPPDPTISTADGSGADRLREYTLNGETFRFGVYSYGDGGPVDPPDPPDDDTGGGTGGGSDGGTGGETGVVGSSDGGDEGGGWGHCKQRTLAPPEDLQLEGMGFDRILVHYTIPAQDDPAFDLYRVRVFSLAGEKALTDATVGAAIEHPVDTDAVTVAVPASLEIDELFGNYTYQIGVTYEDRCGNRSPLATAGLTTDAQKFQTVEGFCFLATAAFGAQWAAQVQALRWFRDAYLNASSIGRDLVRFYYTYSPPLADVIRHQPLLRGMVRVVLQPVSDAARLTAGSQPAPVTIGAG